VLAVVLESPFPQTRRNDHDVCEETYGKQKAKSKTG
jgi:hypothetical protein